MALGRCNGLEQCVDMHLDLVRVDREAVEEVCEQKVKESFNLWKKLLGQSG